ncbi:MAG: sialidase family protein [Lentisphaerota bacterium]
MDKFIPNAFERLGREFYVSQNHPDASDGNPGTKIRPFKSISQAAHVMRPYDEIIIDEGVYREEIPLNVNGHCYFPEHVPMFKGIAGKQVFIKGSDVFSAKWESLGGGLFKAALPNTLFMDGVYNPYKLGAAIDEHCIVRPISEKSEVLSETLGQFFCDGSFFGQADSMAKLSAGHWLVSACGKYIIANFGDMTPGEHFIEISVRKRCFKPEFSGTVYIKVLNICVEHAAEPGPFCRFRAETLRKNVRTGISVRKTFNLPGTTSRQCRLFAGEVSYLSKDDNRLYAKNYDDTEPREKCFVYDAVSHDAAMTWQRVSDNYPAASNSLEDIFLDTDLKIMIKTGVEWAKDAVSESGGAIKNKGKFRTFYCLSGDSGKNWTERKYLGYDLYPYRIIKMSGGEYLLPCCAMDYVNGFTHASVRNYMGEIVPGKLDIELSAVGSIAVAPEESEGGLAEPRAVELPDGRILLLLRMGAILPSQTSSGIPSVKYFSVSEDKGKTWRKPSALTYNDGTYVYSPRSYQEIFRSSKNGRIYAIMNICDKPTTGCDPRDVLQIVEIDPDNLCAKKDTVSIVEARHPDADSLVRFSNWLMFESRNTLNPVILMRQHMSEYCPNRFGYDLSSYRYEINLPEK